VPKRILIDLSFSSALGAAGAVSGPPVTASPRPWPSHRVIASGLSEQRACLTAAAARAAISAIFLTPYYPVWSLIYIAIAIMVIYGLSARYGEQTRMTVTVLFPARSGRGLNGV
jgi:hypothetical protein